MIVTWSGKLFTLRVSRCDCGFRRRDRICQRVRSRLPLGVGAGCMLALLVVAFVEKFYFTLRHGLTTTYKNGKQRIYAQFWYRILQATMVLNATLLGLWIIGIAPPPWLLFYNHYSIAIHFCAALIGVSAVRDSDAVIENRMLELKAETARQDLITARKAAAIGSPLVLIFAKLRGFFDSVSLSFRLLFRGGGFAKDYAEQIDVIAKTQYAHLDNITTPHGRRFPASVTPLPKRPGATALNAPPVTQNRGNLLLVTRRR